jgi:5S rRNA maturation endonuclease (ribonuclease M5)
MYGVIFELGWLCGKYNRKETSERVRIIADFDFQWRKITRYIQSLIHNSQTLLIDQMNGELISASIHNNVTTSINVYKKE